MRASAQEYQLHRRICARDDPTAFVELATWLYDSLVQHTRKRAGKQADPILIEEAVGETLLDYHDHPERYDPHQMTLSNYLVMAAHRDFQNSQARERRVAAHQVSLFDPALQEQDISGGEEPQVSDFSVEDIWHIIDTLFPEEQEQRVVELILRKERSIEPYVEVLCLGDLSYEEQVRQVKLVKYRLTRRMRRNMSRYIFPEGETQ